MDWCEVTSLDMLYYYTALFLGSLFVSITFNQKVMMLNLPPSPFPSVSPLRPRCLCPGSRLFMSLPTGNPLNVTVCSKIRFSGSPWKGLRENSKEAYPRVLCFFFLPFSWFLIKTGLNRIPASTRAGLHFFLLLSFVVFKERRPAVEGLWANCYLLLNKTH